MRGEYCIDMSYYFLFWEGEELDKGKAEYIPNIATITGNTAIP